MSVTPIPPNRGRWRLTLHNRAFTGATWDTTVIAQLDQARSRSLTRQWNTPAELRFTLDGHDPAAAMVTEMATEVAAWRWDESGYRSDVCMFRGVVDHSEDQLSEQTMTTNFVAHDLMAMTQRRYLTAPYNVTQRDQDLIVADLLYQAINAQSSAGPGGVGGPVSFSPGSYLPLVIQRRNPDGTLRGPFSGQLRDRNYTASAQIFQLLDDLSKVINGFDWEVRPWGGGQAGQTTTDELTVFYPAQGVARTDVPLVYGSTVAALTRTVASADYANYQRLVGNNGTESPAAAQLFSEAWNADANNVTQSPVGLWMASADAADVSIQSTLDQQVQGNLALSGLLVPSYTLTLRPDFYTYRNPNVGDTVPLIVLAGRLNVNTTVRVMGITWTIGDDGQEDVGLTVVRPPTTLAGLLTQTDRSVSALARR